MVGDAPTMYSHGLSDGVYDRLRRDVHFSHPRPSRTRQAEIVAQIVNDEILEGSPEVYFTLLCYSAWKGKPITRTLRITPDFARFLLKIHVNWHNRGISVHGLQMYRQDMRDGGADRPTLFDTAVARSLDPSDNTSRYLKGHSSDKKFCATIHDRKHQTRNE